MHRLRLGECEAGPAQLPADVQSGNERGSPFPGWRSAGARWCGAGAFVALSCALLAPCARGDTLPLPPVTNPFVAHPPPPPPPLLEQQSASAQYFHWAKADQYRYSKVPLDLSPRYGTDVTRKGWTIFYTNMPVSWTVTQVGGRADASYDILDQTETHLQLGAGSHAGVWRVTASAISCLDTCSPATCPSYSCTTQLDSPQCTAVAAGERGRPGKACAMAYAVSHYRVLSRWQISVGVALFCAGFALAWYLFVGDCSQGLPGLWQFAPSSSSSWTAPAAPKETQLAAPTYAQRPATQRLRLDLEAPQERGAEQRTRPTPRMFRSASEQEKTALL